MIIAGASITKDNCVRVLFRRTPKSRALPCLFYIPCCRNLTYVRSLITFMRHKLATET